MAGYCSNLPFLFPLVYAVNKARWQVWQLFSKPTRREKVEEKRRGEGEKRRRIEITIGITCHTCHSFYAFGLNKRFTAIATCHQTCHALVAGERGAK
jgi:hypothetical protein